ncbi:MAG: nucleotidyl transferase AbiEii/AbiGii toxin family protein [Ferruginibacter sp.]
MLHYQTVDTPTLELLKGLLSINIFKDLRLVGGTSLSLQFGHRKSVDIDLFGKVEADIFEINDALSSLGEIKIIKDSKNIHVYLVNRIKVDIVNYQYPWIGELLVVDGLRLADINDIAAMKLSAITGRGTKKDFYDLHLLLQYISLKEMLELYLAKYKDGSLFMVLKSLVYFNDADEDIMPILLTPLSWESVKVEVLKTYTEYMHAES